MAQPPIGQPARFCSDRCRGRRGYRRRRARQKNVPRIYYTAADIAARWAMWGDQCWICSQPAEVTDHVKPLKAGGPDMPSNLRPICKSCNSKKNARWPFTPAMLRKEAVA